MLQRLYYLVHGTVQGVGFRYFTEKKALEYGVTGWVRNTTTNKVEGEVQGEEDAVKKFTTAILDGPKHAHVVRLDKDHRAIVEGETGFEIRRGPFPKDSE